MNAKESHLEKSLGPWMLWGLGVGYVISGMYFGWNLGLPKGGTLGMAVAVLFVIVMYVSFSFSYIELACSIPKAGGGLDYTCRALGPRWGVLAGMAQNIEFIFAPPAVALAIGAYLSNWIPEVTAIGMAIMAYLFFTVINILGVKAAAIFELIVTVIALFGLLLFVALALPHFNLDQLRSNPLPNGWSGSLAAIPFAIWFFLGIEGVANVAEETMRPQRDILFGFGFALLTLVLACLLIFTTSIGIDGWESVVYQKGSTLPTDSPLLLALSSIVEKKWVMHLFITLGVFGLVASCHGLMLAGGRAIFDFALVGFAPKALGTTHKRFKTPMKAFLFNMVVGIAILLTGKTGDIIIIACFGALALYIISMVAFLKLRSKEPDLPRPFKTPFYPMTPIIALAMAAIALLTMTIYHFQQGLIFYALLVVSFIGFKLFIEERSCHDK